MLEQSATDSLDYAKELNKLVRKSVDEKKSYAIPWWDSVYAMLVFVVGLWTLQKVHLWAMHDNIVWVDLLLGLMMRDHVSLLQYIVR